jgi:hypothetical protein
MEQDKVDCHPCEYVSIKRGNFLTMQVTVSYQEMTCFVELNISTVSNYWTDSWSYTVTVIMKILSNIQFKENSAPSPICWK